MDRVHAKDVTRLFPDIEAHTVAEVLDLGVTLTDLESVAMWLTGEDDVAGRSRAQSGGPAGRVYDLMVRELVVDDED